jgi:serine protease Do
LNVLHHPTAYIKAMPALAQPRAPRLLLALGLGLGLALAPALQVEARGAPESFADLAEQISPSVVNITTTSVVAANTSDAPMVPPGSPFEDFFKDFMAPNGQGGNEPQRSEALGSGFVISKDGYIVTNNHVIEGADAIEVEFFGGKKLKAKLVGTDLKTDIAVLKVDSPAPLPFVAFGDSNKMRVGDWVLAMGNPLGQGFSVSSGIISARGRELNGAYDDFLQTDAAINKGNSGGPLFNMDGQVIGVNTAILSPSGGSIGIGFSMSSNVVMHVVDQLKEFGETRRGWLGVRIQDVTPDVAEAMSLAEASGALITDVPDGPAKEGGLLAGDVILSFDGKVISDVKSLTRTVADSPIGQEVPVVINRAGAEQTLQIKLGRRETDEADQPIPAAQKNAPEAPSAEVMGLTLVPVDAQVRKDLGLDNSATGLAITNVDQSSEAADKGVGPGDVIVEAGQQKVMKVSDLQDRVTEAKDAGRKSILLLIRRQGDPRFVALSVQ